MADNDKTYKTLLRLVKTRTSIHYLYSLREATVPVHSSSRGVKAEEK
jgi:hypothetical protein